jgi:hypothetical protein
MLTMNIYKQLYFAATWQSAGKYYHLQCKNKLITKRHEHTYIDLKAANIGNKSRYRKRE